MLTPATRIDPTSDLLARLCVSLHGDRVTVDFDRAPGAPVHHSQVPVALVAWARASPVFARGLLPGTNLVDVVTKAPSMDGVEKAALAAVCGVKLDRLLVGSAAAPLFQAQLVRIIEGYSLEAFYFRDPRNAINGIDVRPRGVNYHGNTIDQGAISTWRVAYRRLPPARKMLVATILWLYRGNVDKTWLKGQSCKWHAADAVEELAAVGALQDWGKLVALYPGW
jgi:hypothetical protein